MMVFVATPLVKPLVSRFGKKELASFGLALSSSVYFLLWFLKDINGFQFVAISSLGMLGFAFFNLVIWAFVTDVIDYHEFLTGLREDATVYSIYSMSRKIGQAVAGGLGGFVIGAVGYKAGAIAQTEQALSGIHTLGTLVIGIIFLIVFLIIAFLYPLNKERTIKLTNELAERRKNVQ